MTAESAVSSDDAFPWSHYLRRGELSEWTPSRRDMMDALTRHNVHHCRSPRAPHDRRQTRALRPDRTLVFVNQYGELNDIYLRAQWRLPGQRCAGLHQQEISLPAGSHYPCSRSTARRHIDRPLTIAIVNLHKFFIDWFAVYMNNLPTKHVDLGDKRWNRATVAK
jgi:hypothetical protein